MELPVHHVSILVLIGLVFAYCLRSVWIALTGPLSSIPGPWYTKFTDIEAQFHWLRGNRVRYIQALHLKYGTAVRVGPNEVDFSDLEAAKEIHKVGGTYPKSEFYKHLVPTKQNVFSTIDNPFHSHRRRQLASAMSETSIKNFEPQVEDRVELTIQKMQEEMKTRGAADIWKWFTFMATDVIGELSFGKSFEMLERGEKNQYIEDLESVGMLGAIRAAFPSLIKLASVLPLPYFHGKQQQSARLRDYATQSINRYKDLVDKNPDDVPLTFFTKLLNGGKNGLSQEDVIPEAQVYIVAGSDTTANSLTYLIWALTHHPEIQKALVKEVQSLQDDFTDMDARKLTFLENVISETLRLYAPAPSALPRLVPKQGATLVGHYLPAGTTVATQAWSLHRDPTVFPDPESFNPSRWEDATKAMKDAAMPFGGGSRICLGMHLAKMELRLATIRFFRAFPDVRMSKLEGMCDEEMEQNVYFLAGPRGHRCLVEA